MSHPIVKIKVDLKYCAIHNKKRSFAQLYKEGVKIVIIDCDFYYWKNITILGGRVKRESLWTDAIVRSMKRSVSERRKTI